MPIQYQTDEERKLHLSIIHSLADHYHLDEAMIRELYESKLQSLMNDARVKTYLSVLTERYIKNLLLEGRVLSPHGGQADRRPLSV